MTVKTRASSRKTTKKGKPPKKLPFSAAALKSWLGYTLAFSAIFFLLLFSIQLGPSLVISLLQALVRVFGAGVFVPLLAAFVSGAVLVAGSKLQMKITVRWNLLVGIAVLICLFFGTLAFMRPTSVSVSGVKLSQVTAGGELGQMILGAPDLTGLGRLILLAVVSFSCLTPFRALALVKALKNAGLSIASRARTALLALRARRRETSNDPILEMEMPEFQRPTADEPEEDEVVYEVPASTLSAKRASRPVTVESPMEAPALGGPPYALPPIDLLDKAMVTDLSKVDVRQRIKLIEDKLAEYGVDAKVVEVNQGPAFTQFGIEPGWDVKVREVKERDPDGKLKYDKDGKAVVRLEEISRTRVKVSRITALANDLALALAAPTIRIEAPVPGKSMVGIEVPNISASVVSLRSVIESTAFQRVRGKSKLALGLGQGVEGEATAGDLARMPHLLIAGATGSGKSVCINGIIASILMHATPDEVKFLMVDPKRVELIAYDGVPHLLCPVIVDMSKVVGVLRWAAKEMDERYKQFAEAGARNIQSFNEKMAKAEKSRLPYLVLIIDELADLMMMAADEVERIICRLAQLARATGIHLIIATQRPSVDVVTGLIKANIPTRIAFAVTSQVDSRTILDMAGAEKLLGRGDMLYMPTDAAKPIRLQGAFVADAEIESLVAWWKNARPTRYVDELLNLPEWSGEGGWEEEDPKLEEAKRLIEQGTHPSVSFLQRRLRVGYNRAKRIMERLEDEGLVDEVGEEEGFTRFST